jgi:hypothetical protein
MSASPCACAVHALVNAWPRSEAATIGRRASHMSASPCACAVHDRPTKGRPKWFRPTGERPQGPFPPYSH